MTSIYVKAAVITAVIFLLGLSAGWYLDWTRSQAAREELDSLRLQAEEARVGMVFFETFKSDPTFCSVYASEMSAQLQRVGRLGEQLETLRVANKLDASYYSLKKQYVLFNVELWLRAENLKKMCGSNVTTILYFYPEASACADCGVQAQELLRLKQSCPERVWLFALPTDLKITVVEMLKQRFGIHVTPSLVFDGETISGMITAVELRERFPTRAGC
ncbi:MAG: hypothetical protein QW343_02640 [Candidatus Norongarragalinales archaeon]